MADRSHQSFQSSNLHLDDLGLLYEPPTKTETEKTREELMPGAQPSANPAAREEFEQRCRRPAQEHK